MLSLFALYLLRDPLYVSYLISVTDRLRDNLSASLETEFVELETIVEEKAADTDEEDSHGKKHKWNEDDVITWICMILLLPTTNCLLGLLLLATF